MKNGPKWSQNSSKIGLTCPGAGALFSRISGGAGSAGRLPSRTRPFTASSSIMLFWGWGCWFGPMTPPGWRFALASISSHSGPPPWRICSRSHTRPIKANKVKVTTATPWRISAPIFSLQRKSLRSWLQKLFYIDWNGWTFEVKSERTKYEIFV